MKLKESLGAAQSQVCASQADGKKLIAYASAAHNATDDSGSNMQKCQTATAKQVHNPDRN